MNLSAEPILRLQNPLRLQSRSRKCKEAGLVIQAGTGQVDDTGDMAGKEGGGLDAASWYDSERDRTIARLTVVDTGQPVFLPFRMSCFVISNLIVTAGMLTPGLQVGSLFTINS